MQREESVTVGARTHGHCQQADLQYDGRPQPVRQDSDGQQPSARTLSDPARPVTGPGWGDRLDSTLRSHPLS